MRVKELIEHLTTQDPEMRVVVNGYETGYDELENVYTVKITPNPKADIKIWEGDFDEVSKNSYEPSETALCFPRKS